MPIRFHRVAARGAWRAWLPPLMGAMGTAASAGGPDAIRTESFDREPSGWEGVNNRAVHFAPRTVRQDFGYSPGTRHAGGETGEVGGRVQPAGEPTYYGWPLPGPLTLDDAMSASGRMMVARGPGHFLLGFFDAGTLKEWRTPNTIVARINGRGEHFHAHFEYCTRRWRAGAGVIGRIVPGDRIEPREIPAGRPCRWHLEYDPGGAEGNGQITFVLDGIAATCAVSREHRADGATFTHFGLLPLPKTWDDAGEIWIDDVVVNGRRFEFSRDPGWEGLNNRRTWEIGDTRPRFDFGWSATHYAGGQRPGELGGLVFRGDCRDPRRMACYGDRIGKLTLEAPLYARGKVAVLRAVTDSTASIGFYNSVWSMRSNPSQANAIPMDYLGINIEGPSGEGFFFYPVYRVHRDASGSLSSAGGAPRIYPDGKVHEWSLSYRPDARGGGGRITVALDGGACALELGLEARRTGATFHRFGLCTPWVDGNSVTVYFDDLVYTCGLPATEAASRPAER